MPGAAWALSCGCPPRAEHPALPRAGCPCAQEPWGCAPRAPFRRGVNPFCAGTCSCCWQLENLGDPSARGGHGGPTGKVLPQSRTGNRNKRGARSSDEAPATTFALSLLLGFWELFPGESVVFFVCWFKGLQPAAGCQSPCGGAGLGTVAARCAPDTPNGQRVTCDGNWGCSGTEELNPVCWGEQHHASSLDSTPLAGQAWVGKRCFLYIC